MSNTASAQHNLATNVIMIFQDVSSYLYIIIYIYITEFIVFIQDFPIS